MFEGIRYHWQLKRLRKDKRRTQQFYRKLIARARHEKKPRDDIDRLIGEERMDTAIPDAERYHLLTQRLIEIAENYEVPYPEFNMEDGNWTLSEVTGRWHLSVEAIAALRADIRKEREHWRLWLAAWTGVIGALIGLASVLVAVWKK